MFSQFREAHLTSAGSWNTDNIQCEALGDWGGLSVIGTREMEAVIMLKSRPIQRTTKRLVKRTKKKICVTLSFKTQLLRAALIGVYL